MEWGSFLLVGDMGQQLDLSQQTEELGRLRRSLARRQSKDLDQDAKIAALAQKNLDLRRGLAALLRMLASQGVVAPEALRAHRLDSVKTRSARTVRSPGSPAPAARLEPCAPHRG